MCFSASASITAGVLLTFVGVETVKRVHKPSQLVFGIIPLFFALQQFSEGVIWLTMPHTEYAGLKALFTYVFIIMAQILWPVMIPLSVLLMEQKTGRKMPLYALLCAGIAVGLYNAYLLIVHGVYAQVNFRHLSYQSDSQDNFNMIALAVYLSVTVLPLFVSSVKTMYVLGIVMALSFAVSAIFYMQCLTSVWCFFAAVISFVIFYILRNEYKQSDYDKVRKK